MNQSYFNLLMAKQGDYLKYARNLGIPPEDAGDVVNDCFEKILQKMEILNLQSEQALFIYARRILKSVAMDYHRKRRKEVLTDFEEAEHQKALVSNYGFSDPEEELLNQEQSEEIRQAVQQLSEEDRELLVDLYYLEMSYSDIAKRTGKNKKTLMQQASRARKKVKKVLRGRTNMKKHVYRIFRTESHTCTEF